ncbi:MAG: 6-phosphogluconolactonase [Deferrisomatales bacterium]|nr:6-phosphogluconolactonase [Deferrisomatales bacterium]
MTGEVRRFPDGAALTEAAAGHIVEAAWAGVHARGRFLWVLSGGSTPLPVYERLASWSPFPWAETHVFWGDERCVPLTNPASNAGAALRALLDRVPIPRIQIHLPPARLSPPEAAARAWEADLRAFFGPASAPPFDLVLLGLGADGHTASLFPGDPVSEEETRWTAAVTGGNALPPVPRITLTIPALRGARGALFLATGREKVELAARIVAEDGITLSYPAARVHGATGATWYLAEEG